MRETAGKLNRTWLATIGLLTILAGTAGILLSSGLAGSLAESSGIGISPVDPNEQVFPVAPSEALNTPLAAIIVTVVAALVGLLALAWLSAQVPKRHQGDTFRLHGKQGSDGYTLCDPKVLASAVESEAEALLGVASASAILRGSANEPELNLDIKMDDRAKVQDVIDSVHRQIAPNLEAALEVPLRRVAVLLNVTRRPSGDKTAVI